MKNRGYKHKIIGPGRHPRCLLNICTITIFVAVHKEHSSVLLVLYMIVSFPKADHSQNIPVDHYLAVAIGVYLTWWGFSCRKARMHVCASYLPDRLFSILNIRSTFMRLSHEFVCMSGM